MNPEIKLIWQTAIDLGFQFKESDAHEMHLKLKDFDNCKKDKIIKQFAHVECFSPYCSGNCCDNGNYDFIELEFESCYCCGSVTDMEWADTKFNEKQLTKLHPKLIQ